MKYFAIFSMIFVLNACSSIPTDKNGKPMLIGHVEKTAFNDTSYSWWWNSEYGMYTVDTTTLANIKAPLSPISVKIVLGTWCSDSRREVPRFTKLMEHLKFDFKNISFICVNRNKETEAKNELSALKIEKVPTFIFYKDGTEIGRITESPTESLEKDLVKIINGK